MAAQWPSARSAERRLSSAHRQGARPYSTWALAAAAKERACSDRVPSCLCNRTMAQGGQVGGKVRRARGQAECVGNAAVQAFASVELSSAAFQAPDPGKRRGGDVDRASQYGTARPTRSAESTSPEDCGRVVTAGAPERARARRASFDRLAGSPSSIGPNGGPAKTAPAAHAGARGSSAAGPGACAHDGAGGATSRALLDIRFRVAVKFVRADVRPRHGFLIL
mmetsp:Transcript_53251/g.147112  ORF Transcript_53251/g.147112 Transcript_53251/m.147112 type:complete len:223 (+) Transcript_53251:924-1592(+)